MERNAREHQEDAVLRREIHSAPPGGRSHDENNSMVLSETSHVSHELEYIAAGRANPMSAIMKDLLQSPVTAQLTREPELPEYEVMFPENFCEWDPPDDNQHPRNLFGAATGDFGEGDEDPSRRAWDREALGGGSSRGVIPSNKHYTEAKGHHIGKKKMNSCEKLGKVGKDESTDKTLFVRPGGMLPHGGLRSSLKYPKASSPFEQKRAVVSFSGDTTGTLSQLPQQVESPDVLGGNSDFPKPTCTEDFKEENIEDFLIYHRKIEPVIPSQRKGVMSPRKYHPNARNQEQQKDDLSLSPMEAVVNYVEEFGLNTSSGGRSQDVRLQMPTPVQYDTHGHPIDYNRDNDAIELIDITSSAKAFFGDVDEHKHLDRENLQQVDLESEDES